MAERKKTGLPLPATVGRSSSSLSKTTRTFVVPPEIRKMYEGELAIFKAQLEAGAGLIADEALREFQRDYQNRETQMGPQGLPTSFQVCRDFFVRARPGQPYRLFPERDFIVSFEDFLEFITDANTPVSSLALGYTLTEGFIYNVNSSDAPSALLLSTQDAPSFGFRAASLIRRGDELTMLLSLAEQPELHTMSELESELGAELEVRPEKRTLLDSEALRREAYGDNRIVVIEGSDLLPSLAAVRFNLKNRSFSERCFFRDMGDRWDTKTDVFAAFAGDISEDNPGFRNMVDQLDRYSTVWEMAKTLTLLPAYLDAKVTLVKTEKRETRIAKLPLSKRREIERAPMSHRKQFRNISAIRIVRPESEPVPGRVFSPPQFQIAVDGFWRALQDPDQTGKDAEGLPVVGRTWVRAHVRHKDRPAPSEIKTIYVKASLADARRRIEEYRRRMAKQPEVSVPEPLDVVLPVSAEASESKATASGMHGAYVYIMRCQAHLENLYKVGFTDRDPEVRARELSSTTATPSPFEVVRAWPVAEGLAAERAAHAALRSVRHSATREFFQTAFADLQRVVEEAIRPWILKTP
ncbi:GIY-YIG nuclease family protein [Paraburkholderia sp. J41]|uniref:GIY-YIG nuclease family protein n=1 Tax=Paraburkholderia sp. J41 TaxID=2805433 RepID=UPI002AC37188|nr:GIY-YIG nuclease family protein [Paraburkholderia sp. J41]